MISLENLQGFPLKSSAVLSHMNPPKIPINSAGNVLKIPEESTPKIPLNIHMDSQFTCSPTFRVDSPPPSIRHPQGFPAESL